MISTWVWGGDVTEVRGGDGGDDNDYDDADDEGHMLEQNPGSESQSLQERRGRSEDSPSSSSDGVLNTDVHHCSWGF